MNGKKFPPGLIEEAKGMLASGMSFNAIGKRLHVYPQTVREALDPGYKAKRLEERRAAYHATKVARKRNYVRDAVGPPVPKVIGIQDTRDLTGIICGDPLPGRSALDKRRTENGRHCSVVSLYRAGSSDGAGGVLAGP